MWAPRCHDSILFFPLQEKRKEHDTDSLGASLETTLPTHTFFPKAGVSMAGSCIGVETGSAYGVTLAP